MVYVPTKDDGKKVLNDLSQPAIRITLNDSCAVAGDESEKEGVLSGVPVGRVWHELLAELMHLEATSAYWALQAANPAELEFQNFQRTLETSAVLRRANEVACDERIICLDCGREYFCHGSVMVAPCECGCDLFAIGVQH